MNPPNSPDNAPLSPQLPVQPIQPTPQTPEASNTNLDALLRPEASETQPYTKLVEKTVQLMNAATNAPKLQDETVKAYGRTAEAIMKESIEPAKPH